MKKSLKIACLSGDIVFLKESSIFADLLELTMKIIMFVPIQFGNTYFPEQNA
jgi:hypothetical protein